MARKNVVGEVYGRLTITSEAPNKGKHRRVVVTCACGAVKEVFLTVLRSGDAVSCGCYKQEISTTHGQSRGNPLYRTWSNMKSRCNDPNAKYYGDYGGRGIRVCDDWATSFESFHEWALSSGYSTNLTLDRKDNYLDYSPENCRWVDRTTQQRNRRSQRQSSSQYVGVSFVQKYQKWVASIKINGTNKNLGRYPTELEAAVARDTYICNNGLTDFTMNGVL